MAAPEPPRPRSAASDLRRDPTAPDPTREELAAALATRKELGEQYEAALVESFLDRVDAGIASRVDQQVAARLAERDRGEGGEGTDSSLILALGSVGMGIPITAISAGTSGLGGLLVAWTGIAAINAAHAFGRSRRR